MTNKHMTTSSFIQKRKANKTRMRYYFTLLEWLKLERLTKLSVDEAVEKLKFSYNVHKNVMVQSLWKIVRQFL